MLLRLARVQTRGCRSYCWHSQRDTLSHLRDKHANREIYLVGTAHVSQHSADEVTELIKLVRPDHVAVELCPQRAAKLRAGDREQDFSKALVNAFGGAGAGMLGAAFQALNGIWKQYGLVPGVDFKAALNAADSAGIPVHCIDRDVNETLERLRGALGDIDLAKLLTTPPPAALATSGIFSGTGGMADAVETLKNREQVAALRRHMNTVAPSVLEVMLHQRNAPWDMFSKCFSSFLLPLPERRMASTRATPQVTESWSDRSDNDAARVSS